MESKIKKAIRTKVKKSIESILVSGATKLIILGKIKHHSTYPYEIFKQLKTCPFTPVTKTSKSDVYNILNSLESKGLVKSESVLAGSKVQKKYSITPEGARITREAKKILIADVKNIKKLIYYEFQ
jgi:DNA-binding PadR family transcriptional regulator